MPSETRVPAKVAQRATARVNSSAMLHVSCFMLHVSSRVSTREENLVYYLAS